MTDEWQHGNANEHESGRERSDELSPEELTQRLLELAESGSGEEIQRMESVLRIATLVWESKSAPLRARMELMKHELESSQARLAAAQDKVDDANERLAAHVTAMAEGLKLQFETYKNLTVLDSGALVAFAVVTHNLVDSPVLPSLLTTAYAFVMASLIGSLTMMSLAGDRVYDVMQPGPPSQERRGWRVVVRLADALAGGAFVIGLALFLVFLQVNL